VGKHERSSSVHMICPLSLVSPDHLLFSRFEESNRLVTVFCYLNSVTEGGATRFEDIDLEIQPTKGTAVVHFPSDIQLRGDDRTQHQGMPAVDDKWLLTAWVWSSKSRTVSEYDESNLPSLSSDII